MPAHLLQIAKKLAGDAGQLALKIQEKGFTVHSKNGNNLNLVTSADIACEELITKTIKTHFPDHSIVTEESEPLENTGEYKWIIDPLDGTSNFSHGLPIFAISIAIVHKGKPIIGVVEIPGLRETFWAEEGSGAYLNGKKILVSQTAELGSGLFTTGFPYDRTGARYQKNMELFKAVYTESHGVRRMGSAAMDLCFLAAGRFDAFWEYGLEAWDIAAGKIIVEEAGGLVTNMDGTTLNPKLKNMLATNRVLHPTFLKIIKDMGGDKI